MIFPDQIYDCESQHRRPAMTDPEREKLVEDLRYRGSFDRLLGQTMFDAANCIEAQAAEKARLYKEMADRDFDADTMQAEIARLNALVEQVTTERDAVLQQAQGHAMEARTANSTIAEIYQAVTGATGEPGNWNGAQPVIKALAERDKQIAVKDAALGLAIELLCGTHEYQPTHPVVAQIVAALERSKP